MNKPASPRLSRRPLSKLQIQARLVERGSNFRQFALTHDYKPRSVTQAVDRWAGQAELPRGRLTYRILQDLSKAAGAEVIPGILADAQPSVSP